MAKLPHHGQCDEDLDPQENHCNGYDNNDYHIVDNLYIITDKLFMESEAVLFTVFFIISILRNHQGYHNDNHQKPHSRTGSNCVQFSVEFDFVSALEEDEVPDDQDHHVEEEGEVHVYVQHGTHKLAER